ncbi:ABC-2 type transport system ATP-binding protein [Actinoplanes octamycinicus]|uniref:ABC-2 type transport system ATP-binding protein n=1 Tax=Actinoplanes octamycinicus TaxID=135948 RepID=A0A7W7H365_9ACTN|nr:hypothetical protein [Actinoplanes octamycinicus]MBB4743078.1 ABC-2 type transport system ATP-binding protein [Actinoplanes octamycinicus]GIE61360.1 hypothetical protein Aoc01nite_67620 [Actinoplanes octamycinicus]
MIAVLRSELYRTLTVPASLIALAGFGLLAALTGWFDEDFWSLLAALGTFSTAVMVTAQHYQHRTALLVFLGRPQRLTVLAVQCVVAVLIGVLLVAVSGITVLRSGEGSEQYFTTLAATPLIAVFGVANATIVRRPLWLLVGYLGWLVFAEGLIGRLESPLPFSSFLMASAGDPRALFALACWTGAALPVAAWSISRDLSGD